MTEFAHLCALHLPPRSRVIPIEEHKQFLERCCDLGLLSREYTREGIRFSPTPTLLSIGD